MKQTARNNAKHQRQLSLNVLVDISGESQKEFLDIVASHQNIQEEYLKSKRIMDVRRAISKLQERKLKLLKS